MVNQSRCTRFSNWVQRRLRISKKENNDSYVDNSSYQGPVRYTDAFNYMHNSPLTRSTTTQYTTHNSLEDMSYDRIIDNDYYGGIH